MKDSMTKTIYKQINLVNIMFLVIFVWFLLLVLKLRYSI